MRSFSASFWSTMLTKSAVVTPTTAPTPMPTRFVQTAPERVRRIGISRDS